MRQHDNGFLSQIGAQKDHASNPKLYISPQTIDEYSLTHPEMNG